MNTKAKERLEFVAVTATGAPVAAVWAVDAEHGPLVRFAGDSDAIAAARAAIKAGTPVEIVEGGDVIEAGSATPQAVLSALVAAGCEPVRLPEQVVTWLQETQPEPPIPAEIQAWFEAQGGEQ